MTETFSKKRAFVHQHFLSLIKGAEKIIVSDADLIQSNIDFLLQCREHDVPVIIKTKQNPNKRNIVANLYDEPKNTFLEFVATKIAEYCGSTTVVVCFDSKKMIDNLLSYFNKKQIHEYFYIYTSDTGDVRDILDDINEMWKNKIIIYSPSITTGVDLQIPAHVFGYFSGKSISYRIMYQMIERVRHKLSCHINVRAPEQKLYHLSSTHYIDDLKYNLTLLNHKYIHHTLKSYIQSNERGELYFVENIFSKITVEEVFRLSKDKVFPKYFFEELLQLRRYDIVRKNLTDGNDRTDTTDDPKSDDPKSDVPKSDVPKSDELNPDVPKSDELKSDDPKPDEMKSVIDILVSNNFLKYLNHIFNDLGLESKLNNFLQTFSLTMILEPQTIMDYRIQEKVIELKSLTPDILDEICTTLKIKDSRMLCMKEHILSVLWYDVYLLLIKVLRSKFSHHLIKTIPYQKQIGIKKYKIANLVIDSKGILSKIDS